MTNEPVTVEDFLTFLSQSVPPLFPVMFTRQLQHTSESDYPLPLQKMLTSVIEWAKQKEKTLVRCILYNKIIRHMIVSEESLAYDFGTDQRISSAAWDFTIIVYKSKYVLGMILC